MEKWHAVPFTQVTIADRFWAPRRETNRTVSLPHSLDMLEQTGAIRNFDRAARQERDGYEGLVFSDSDVYKALEACSYSLATDPDPALDGRLDAIIARVAAAQRPDGYLNTAYQVQKPEKRFTNLRDDHELYCAGHLFEAAVAHVQATGKRALLEVACRFADLLSATFGDEPEKREGYCGHPEIELALVKLARVTGEARYFELARYFVEARGARFFAREHATRDALYDGEYWQDNVPIREHRRIVGHAVRAAYLFSGVTDIVRETDDPGMRAMLDRVWKNTTRKNLYVTGGIGPSASNEGFTEDYDLPNRTAYQETCASVAIAMWAHRLNLLYGEASYADVLERALYNGMLAGVSRDGRRFFYVNPLASDGTHHRREWFGCACCPPNAARTLAALGGYAYAMGADGLTVNLYLQGTVRTELANIAVATDYPWDGRVTLTVEPEADADFTLRLRVPGWCERITCAVNGKATPGAEIEKGYVVVRRTWKGGDAVTLDLAMPIRRTAAHPNVIDDRGKLAIERGPLVYCLEELDQETAPSRIALPIDASLSEVPDDSVLDGAIALTGVGLARVETEWPGGLYAPAPETLRTAIRAIPYCLWDNRASGEMAVWLPTAPPPPVAGGIERVARVSLSHQSSHCRPDGIHDGIEPRASGEQPPALCHFWPRKGTLEWAQYDWSAPRTISGAQVYWFDDTGRGECRAPSSWRLLVDGKPLALTDGLYATQLDRWVTVRFDPIETASVRLELQLQDGWAAGVHEWRILTPEDDL